MRQNQDDDLNVGAQIRLRHFDYRDSAPAYHVVICANRPHRPFTDPRLATAIISSLHWLREHRAVQIYAYCLMPDHLHLLLRLTRPDWTLSQIIGAFKSYTTKVGRELGHGRYLWQRRFYDHILRQSEDAVGRGEYSRQNPVRAGLVEDAEAYPYSGYLDPM